MTRSARGTCLVIARVSVLAVVVVLRVHAQSSSPLNRIVSIAYPPGVPHWSYPPPELLFTDTDTGATSVVPMASGDLPGTVLTMDVFGGVWLMEGGQAGGNPANLRRYAPSGTQTAQIPMPSGLLQEIVPTPQGTVIVAILSGTNGVWLYEYDPTGALWRSLNVTTLFAPGALIPPTSFVSQIRVLMSSSGGVWVGLKYGATQPLIRLDANWSLQFTVPLVVEHLLPGSGEGVWVIGVPVVGQPAPAGLPVVGEACHVDANGVVTEAPPGTLTAGNHHFSAHIAMRPDGAILFRPQGNPAGNFVQIHPAGHCVLPFFPSSLDVTWPRLQPPGAPTWSALNQQIYLDGRNRIWTQSFVSWPYVYPNLRWYRVPAYAPHDPIAIVPQGDSTWGAPPLRGAPTLHTFALYTDPLGDLDGDGILNRSELVSGSNPFVASGPALVLTITYPPAATGGWLVLDYSLPGEAGMPYFAPLSLTATRSSVLGQWAPIDVAMDPLVSYAWSSQSWLTGTLGTTDATGSFQVQLNVPPSIPAGTTIFSTFATADQGLTSLRLVGAPHLVTF